MESSRARRLDLALYRMPNNENWQGLFWIPLLPRAILLKSTIQPQGRMPHLEAVLQSLACMLGPCVSIIYKPPVPATAAWWMYSRQPFQPFHTSTQTIWTTIQYDPQKSSTKKSIKKSHLLSVAPLKNIKYTLLKRIIKALQDQQYCPSELRNCLDSTLGDWIFWRKLKGKNQ